MFDVGRYEEASRALGFYDSRKEIDWLLKFSRSALDELLPIDREAIRYRLVALTNRGQLWLGKGELPDIVMAPDGGNGFGEEALLPTDDAVRATQRHVQNIFHSLAHGSEVAMELGSIKIKISTQYTRGRQSALVMTEADTDRTQLNLRLAMLLRLHGGYIRECGRCQKRFLARRKDQTFCSHACMNQEMQRRDRTRKRDKKEEAEQRQRDRKSKKQAKQRQQKMTPTHRPSKGARYGKKTR